MRERIDICVPDAVLADNAQRRQRLARADAGLAGERVPVVVDAQLWACLQGRGGSFAEMLAGPRQHLRALLLNHKWRVENIPDDRPIETETVVVENHFGSLRGVEFPLEITWQGDDQPKTQPLIHAPEQIDSLPVPDPLGGLNARRAAWYHAMRDLASEFDLRLNGQPLEIQIDLTHPGGPFPSAFALCGTNLFLWMRSDPARVERLLEITTRSHLQVLAAFAEITGRPSDHPIWMGADAAEMISPAMFRRFVAPRYLEVWAAHRGPRVFHMCGKIDHLLPILRDELHIDRLDGFGFPVAKERLGAELGGRVVLRGGPHPLLVHDGPPQAIQAECAAYIQAIGPAGFILSEGFGLMPGTPPEHIAAMVASTREMA